MPKSPPVSPPTERNDGLRRLLTMPAVYQNAQRAIGSDRSSRRLAAEVIRSTGETSIVDIGCGTADIVEYIEFATYTGFDPNPAYARSAAERLAGTTAGTVDIFAGALGDGGLDDRLPKSADLVIMMGVLHHLDDAMVDAALDLSARLTGERGRFVAFDPGLVEGQPRLARALINRDRGQNVRTIEATRSLVERHFSRVDIAVHHDFLRVPYTHLVVEATNHR